MGKADRLCNIVQPFAALFWDLGNVCTRQHLTLLAGPAFIVHKACPYIQYMVSVGSIPNKDASAPSPFLSYLGMLFIYALNRSAYLPGGCGCVYLVPVGV